MHIEVQVALNFVISYLYNKLPRRRVNIFGEELEKALKEKFEGHWYPDKPFKGSAFRCLKTGDPVDPVLQRAAREAGVPVHDVLDNLPHELAVWVDPGEVSYRIGEKGAVKLLLSESGAGSGGAGGEGSPAGGGGSSGGGSGGGAAAASAEDREVTRTFNPEAQCFRPVEADAVAGATSPQPAPSPAGSPSPVAPTFLTRPPPPPLTFTTATFAQTKFGSTKLKTSSKRANRMSPTEFSNYIKQRAMQQQQQQQQLQSPRPLSPADFYVPGYGPPAHGSHFGFPEMFHTPPPPHPHHQVYGAGAGAGAAASTPDGPPPPKTLLPPPPHHYQAHSPYQHLLVAN